MVVAGRRRRVPPSTMIAPFMPGVGMARDRAQERDARRGHVDLDGAVSPAAAATVVPSANVTSWRIAPLFTSLTSYVPALSTSTCVGS